MKIKELKYLVPRSNYYKIVALQLNSFFVILLEMLSLGLVPLLVLVITDYKFFLEKIKIYDFFNISNYVISLEKKEFILLFAIFFLVIFLLKNLFIIFLNFMHNKFIKDLRVSTVQLLLKSFLNKPFLFYLNENPSVLIRKITTDIPHAYNYLSSFMKLIRESVLVIFIITTLIFIDPILYSSIFITFIFLTILLYYVFKILLKKRSIVQQNLHSENLKNLTQLFNSIKEVKIFNKEGFFYDMFRKNINTLENVNFFNNFLTSLPRVFFEVLSIFAIISLVVFFVLSGKSDTVIVSTISLLGVAIIRFVPAFNTISVSLSSLRWFQPSMKVIIDDLKNSSNETLNKTKIKNISIKKSINLKNLSFSYDEKKVLEEINFEIIKGAKVGIIGISGSGKTTLINLIMGLIKPSKGSIFIDDMELTNENNIINLIEKIGYVPQDPYILDDSIQNNIIFGSTTNKDKLKKAIINSQLEDLVNSLPEKEHTKVGNTGSRLSGGQKQRLSIARALYNEPEIIILDEATSALDQETEEIIINNLFMKNKDKTFLLITHRKSSLKYCEKIYEIKENKIQTLENKKN